MFGKTRKIPIPLDVCNNVCEGLLSLAGSASHIDGLDPQPIVRIKGGVGMMNPRASVTWKGDGDRMMGQVVFSIMKPFVDDEHGVLTISFERIPGMQTQSVDFMTCIDGNRLVWKRQGQANSPMTQEEVMALAQDLARSLLSRR